jgi:UDP-N-acetylmuramoyl-L-alanyl-D-glutamate--2,6-diaminopimelate ligase
MVALRELIRDLPLAPPPALREGAATTEISGVSHDSRQVAPGDLFVAVAGAVHDGRRFAGDAVGRGAVAVLGQGEAPEGIPVPWLEAGVDPRQLLGPLAARVYGHPDRELTLVGVTGTNGKSTVVTLLGAVLDAAGHPAGTVGTLGYRFQDLEVPAARTTPEASDLFRLLRRMRDAGAEAAAMEVSSHALSLGRVEGAAFDGAVFTNLTRDHLDYHGDMEGYFAAKAQLFELLKPGGHRVINVDDVYGRRLAAQYPDAITYSTAEDSIAAKATVRLEGVERSFEGTRGQVVTPEGGYPFECGLLGDFNTANIAAVVATAFALQLPPAAVQRALAAARPVPGRLEPVRLEGKGGALPQDLPNVLVDYAHTPSALEAALAAARELAGAAGQVIAVFGCGGNRDQGKRPLMGRIAGEGADLPILTSDNPRDEDPMEIIRQVEAGLRESGNANYRVLPDRREAIRRAVAVASPGAVVVVAGKGHEAVQVIGSEALPFSDRQEVLTALEVRRGGASRG